MIIVPWNVSLNKENTQMNHYPPSSLDIQCFLPRTLRHHWAMVGFLWAIVPHQQHPIRPTHSIGMDAEHTQPDFL